MCEGFMKYIIKLIVLFFFQPKTAKVVLDGLVGSGECIRGRWGAGAGGGAWGWGGAAAGAASWGAAAAAAAAGVVVVVLLMKLCAAALLLLLHGHLLCHTYPAVSH